MGAKIPKKRRKKSGIVYFAVNNRLEGMVKIGMTIDTSNARLKYANKKNEFMPGIWEINQKVKTRDAKQTEKLAHELFAELHDAESVSEEMYFTKDGMSVKEMADLVREKDKIHQKYLDKVKKAKQALKDLEDKHKKELMDDIDSS